VLILPQFTPNRTQAVCFKLQIEATPQKSHKKFQKKGELIVHTIGNGFDLIRYNDQENAPAQAALMLKDALTY
jgi:hypothetical protein